jgi:hypothetical protein
MSRQVLLVAALLAASLVCFAFWQITDPPFVDFYKAYYQGGAAILSGEIERFRPLLREAQFVNPPIAALPFAPLAYWGDNEAALIFTFLGALVAVAAWWALARLLDMSWTQSLILLALFLVNGPLIYSIRIGNSTHFILLLAVLAMLALKAHRPALSGAVFALTAVFKPLMLLVGVYFLLARNWRAVAGGVAALVVVALASVAIFGVDLHREWIEHAILPFLGRPIVAYNNQSLDAFLLRLYIGPDHAHDWSPQTPGETHAFWRVVLVAWVLLATAAIVLVSRKARHDAVAEIGLVLTAAIIISPVSWSHYHCLLLVPWAVLLVSPSPPGAKAMLAVAVVLGSVPTTEFGWQHDYWRTLASAQFLGAVVTFAALGFAMLASGFPARLRAPAGRLPAPSSPV